LKDPNGRYFPKLHTLILAFMPAMKRKKGKQNKNTNTSHHSLERLRERQPPLDWLGEQKLHSPNGREKFSLHRENSGRKTKHFSPKGLRDTNELGEGGGLPPLATVDFFCGGSGQSLVKLFSSIMFPNRQNNALSYTIPFNLLLLIFIYIYTYTHTRGAKILIEGVKKLLLLFFRFDR